MVDENGEQGERAQHIDTRIAIVDTRIAIIDARGAIIDKRAAIIDTRVAIIDTRVALRNGNCHRQKASELVFHVQQCDPRRTASIPPVGSLSAQKRSEMRPVQSTFAELENIPF
ncbi:hypothetical protein RFN28_30570 [Mesorhizobium sp. VK24D]|uniref:Uncharacterized protein n=1 Tax=Mesorhizobium album TaxID=3072314 RepID=A0ABU4Y762_9HYPH|nr:hypothetical protein [Mesorhizobium sp. VK24D]